jgi:membrane AbrB-like protein
LNLSDRPPLLLWALLLAVSTMVTGGFMAVRLPAAMMLGPMISGIILGANGARLTIPPLVLTICFGMVSCMIARTIDPALLRLVMGHWPIFLAGAVLVITFGLLLGVTMALTRLLPGTTPIWGSAPGAVTIMLVMAAEAGADVQLAAVMQFMRVVIVAGAAAVIALLFGTPNGHGMAISAVPPVPFSWAPFLATLALGTGGALLGQRLRVPGGSMLLPMFSAILLSDTGLLVITQPTALLMCAYILFGWSVGLGFTRETVIHAARMMPRIVLMILLLMALCAGLSYAMHLALGTDPLTAFLAMAPSGMDLIAVIAASTHVDMSQVMGMQVARFMLISFAGPWCIARVAHWVERKLREPPVGPVHSDPAEDGIELEMVEPFE